METAVRHTSVLGSECAVDQYLVVLGSNGGVDWADGTVGNRRIRDGGLEVNAAVDGRGLAVRCVSDVQLDRWVGYASIELRSATKRACSGRLAESGLGPALTLERNAGQVSNDR